MPGGVPGVALASLLVAAVVRLPSTTAPGVAVVGALAAPLAVLVAASLGGWKASAWAGTLLALSPIHALASRSGAPEVLPVSSLLLACGLSAAADRQGRRGLALALGLPVAHLLVSGSAPFAAAALLLLLFLAARRDRREVAAIAALTALALAAAAALSGLARSPVELGADAALTPAATASGVGRCAVASFTRVIGIEYQLLVSQARYALPLTAVFVSLMALGARRLRRRERMLAAAGVMLPFALGAAMAMVTGHVAPLQAHRLLAALPFSALLLAVGLAALRGARAWAAGVVATGSLLVFLGLALAH